ASLLSCRFKVDVMSRGKKTHENNLYILKKCSLVCQNRTSRTARQPNRYYTENNFHCRNCNKTGHLSKNCPKPKKLVPCFLCGNLGHLGVECPNKYCSNCGQPGHVFDTCSEKRYWYKQCHRCSMKGHFFDVSGHCFKCLINLSLYLYNTFYQLAIEQKVLNKKKTYKH
uniref:Zinc finger CCHC domain-containing protein 7 n=1 Tax=Oryzias melastigma TaxID=30732 RepID=A0A3B3DK31_ORYME